MGILNFPFIHWWILSYSVYLLTAECLSGCVKVPYFQYQPETVTSMGLKIPVAQYTPTSDLCVHPDARAFEFWFKWSVLILKQFGFYVILRRILDAICNFFFSGRVLCSDYMGWATRNKVILLVIWYCDCVYFLNVYNVSPDKLRL